MASFDLSEALLAPFRSGDLPAPKAEARILVWNASEGLWPSDMPGNPVFQTFSRARTDALRKTDRTVIRDLSEAPAPHEPFDLAVLSAPRQTDEARAALAACIEALVDGGTVLCVAPKTAGGQRLKSWAEDLGLSDIRTDARAHCRTLWARKGPALDMERSIHWQQAGAPRLNPTGLLSCPGLFGWDRVDRGSDLLRQTLPDTLTGSGADFGCGYGTLSVHLLKTALGITALHAFDDDARAILCCAQNMAGLDRLAIRETHWTNLSAPWSEGPRFDWIVMNPPFHDGPLTDIALGQRLVAAACAALRPGGTLWMVANAHLPYGSLLTVLFAESRMITESNGFRIYRAQKG